MKSKINSHTQSSKLEQNSFTKTENIEVKYFVSNGSSLNFDELGYRREIKWKIQGSVYLRLVQGTILIIAPTGCKRNQRDKIVRVLYCLTN